MEYAGAHHENLNGTGYPHRLKKDDLSIPARILGLADRFEGISAPDRPYRKTKMTLSGALGIMHKMRDDEHIDPDLFDLFINKKIYMDYARRHLAAGINRLRLIVFLVLSFFEQAKFFFRRFFNFRIFNNISGLVFCFSAMALCCTANSKSPL